MARRNVYILAVKYDKFAQAFDDLHRENLNHNRNLSFFVHFIVKYDLKYDILLMTMILEADK